MKHINFTKAIIATSFATLTINPCVFASSHFSVNSNNVHIGESFTATVNLNNIAAWNVHINASGPVNGCSMAQADASIDAKNTNKTFNVSCTATGAGTIQINLSGDTTTENGNNEILAESINVLVTEKETSSNPTPNPTPDQMPIEEEISPNPAPDPITSQESSRPSSYNNNRQSTKSQPSQSSISTSVTNEEPSKSNNTDVSISVSEYTLTKEKEIYKTTVPYNVSEIIIKATPKDEKTTVTGDGIIQLETGKNNVTITATSEDGTTKTYNLEITKQENPNNDTIPKEQKNDNTTIIIIVLVVLLILALGGIIALMLIIKKQKKRADNKKDNPSPIDTTTGKINPYDLGNH